MSRCFLLAILFLTLHAYAQPGVVRQDFAVKEGTEVRLFVREVLAHSPVSNVPAILLIHGARVPGVPSFDLEVPGGSLAADLADRGMAAYVMDVRGYGRSTRPKEMDEPPSNSPALVRSSVAARDIGAVVDWIRERRHIEKVALFGWATGGQWAGYYASLFPEKVGALIMLNSLYGANSAHPLMGHGSDMEDKAHLGHFNSVACGSYRFNDQKSLFGIWDRSIPIKNKDEWRDPNIARAYAASALASDPTSSTRTPPSFRSPCGALEDSFYLATGRQLWDASLITAPTLILASERDFWSRPEDLKLLEDHLTHAAKVKAVVLKDATHFVHLDRPEHGRQVMVEEIVNFVGKR
jgi:pimeloyl-ACP methyl ester carboxylesterase